MYSRNLFVPDFVRRFFVSCAQISEAYAVRTLMKFGCDWRKISHKSRCRKDSESTFFILSNDVWVTRDFSPFDTGLLRASHSHNPSRTFAYRSASLRFFAHVRGASQSLFCTFVQAQVQ